MIVEKGTLRELFSISINAEKEARELYINLSSMFGAPPEARDFFQSLASDEAEHIRVLEHVRDSLSANTLDGPAPARAFALARGFLRYTAGNAVRKIKTLEDAYQAVVNFEFSELNRMRQILLDLHITDKEKKRKLNESLQAHLDRISAFKLSGVDMKYEPEA